MCIYGRWLKNYLGHRGCRAVIFSLAKFSKLYPYSAKFEWKQCSWSPWLTIDHHRREPSAEGTRHLNILKNRVSETEFPAFLHDFGAKMQGRLRYKIETVFSVCVWLGIWTQMWVFHKCRFFTTVAGRRVWKFECGLDPHEVHAYPYWNIHSQHRRWFNGGQSQQQQRC